MLKFPAIIAIALILTCCSRVEKKQGFRSHSRITESFTSGDWYISDFVKNGDDTNPYANYNFKFTPKNEVIITVGKRSYRGEWSVSGLEGNDSILPVDLNFTIDVQSKLFAEINHNWVIADRMMDEMKLVKASPNHKPVGSITFTKR